MRRHTVRSEDIGSVRCLGPRRTPAMMRRQGNIPRPSPQELTLPIFYGMPGGMAPRAAPQRPGVLQHRCRARRRRPRRIRDPDEGSGKHRRAHPTRVEIADSSADIFGVPPRAAESEQPRQQIASTSASGDSDAPAISSAPLRWLESASNDRIPCWTRRLTQHFLDERQPRAPTPGRWRFSPASVRWPDGHGLVAAELFPGLARGLERRDSAAISIRRLPELIASRRASPRSRGAVARTSAPGPPPRAARRLRACASGRARARPQAATPARDFISDRLRRKDDHHAKQEAADQHEDGSRRHADDRRSRRRRHDSARGTIESDDDHAERGASSPTRSARPVAPGRATRSRRSARAARARSPSRPCDAGSRAPGIRPAGSMRQQHQQAPPTSRPPRRRTACRAAACRTRSGGSSRRAGPRCSRRRRSRRCRRDGDDRDHDRCAATRTAGQRSRASAGQR